MKIKRIISALFAKSVVLSAMVLSSCYKDLSTEATVTFPDIVIENSGEPINIGYGETLVMDPKVRQEGYGTGELTYHWEFDFRPNNKNDRLDLGNELHLEYIVGNTPSNTPYNLTLTVTNPKLGISAISNWSVYVSNSLGEGLLVAYTRDDGATSDLDLVCAENITYDAPESPQYVRNLYSLSNDGAVIDGEVRAMLVRVSSNGAVYNDPLVLVGTDKELLGLSPLNYKVDRRNGDLFYNFSDDKFEVQTLFNFGSYVSGAVVNNCFYANICHIDNMYSKTGYPVIKSDIFTADNVSYAALNQGWVGVFDPNEGKFATATVLTALSGAFMFAGFDDSFTYSLVGGKCLGAGCLKDQRNSFVVRDTDGKDHWCIMKTDNLPTELNSYDLTLPDVDNAVSFAFCDNSDIFYYATPTTIYATVLSGNVTVTQPLTWSPDSADERITMLKHYRQAWYGTQQLSASYEFAIPTNRAQIIIVTHNDKTGEGKIYLRGYNVSTGKFTYSSNGKFDGFGRITAIASTMR